jgi:hypothetical protein
MNGESYRLNQSKRRQQRRHAQPQTSLPAG